MPDAGPIVIMGGGAVGSYVGGMLSAAGEDVVLIDAWPGHVEAVRANGLMLDTPALTDLVAGQVQMSFMSIAPAVPHVKSGALRALAVASAKRFPSLPDVPTVAEAGLPGYDVGSWWGLVAPAGTPREIIQRAEGVVVPFLREASTAARFLEMGLEPGELGAEAFQRYIAAEKDKLAEIVRRAGIQAE